MGTPKKPAKQTIALASMIVIKVEADANGEITREVKVRGNELAHQYANSIAACLEMAVRSAQQHTKEP